MLKSQLSLPDQNSVKYNVRYKYNNNALTIQQL